MKRNDDFLCFIIHLTMDGKYAPCFQDGSLYHYTSPTALQKILFSYEENFKLYASRYDCVNDTSEGKYVIEVYQNVVSRLYQAHMITTEQYASIRCIMPSNKEFIQYSEPDGTITVREQLCNKYIYCFSTDGDSLAMWNYYSKNLKYQGYNIELLGLNAIESLHDYQFGVVVNWYEVQYDHETQTKLIQDFLLEVLQYYTNERVRAIQSLIESQLGKWGMCFKHPCFSHEKEVRAVVSIPVDTECPQLPIEYRQQNMFIIPFVQLCFSKTCVASVMLSPMYCTEGEKKQQVEILSERLHKSKYDYCKVKASQVPIRY